MRAFSISAAILIGLLHFTRAWADDLLVAVVDLKFLEATDKTAQVMCFGDAEGDCAVWATFYLGEVHVRKVIKGSAPADRFLVLYGSHALRKENFKNLVARFEPLEHGAYGNARFQMDWGDRMELACFTEIKAPDAPIELKERDNDPLKCYEMRSEE